MGISSPASLDVYLSHRTGNHTSNELSSRSDTCSPPPIRHSTAPAPSGPMNNNIPINAGASGFLSDKDAKG